MSEILGVYTPWLREVRRYTRERTRLKELKSMFP